MDVVFILRNFQVWFGPLSLSLKFEKDPIISEVPLSKKLDNIETSNGKPVKKTDNISGQLVVNLTTGEELSGRWVGGKREEGLGPIRGPRL